MMMNVRKSVGMLGCWLVLLLSLASCQGDDENESAILEKPGQIPGMGETPGAPQGEKFVLPRKMSATIVGEDPYNAAEGACKFDGAGPYMTVTVTLRTDSTGAPTQVVFPAGLIIVTAAEGFQKGLLIERVVVSVPPKQLNGSGGVCKVSMMLFCLNEGQEGTKPGLSYSFGPITNSPLLKDFIKQLSTKKTLYSEYNGDEDFSRNMEKVQEALWNITNGDGLTERNLEIIRSLPNK